ncbi:hypothetical protein R1flu_028691 [Riccia fluitans]|uniref:Uncharacterized protein n=1 Tax=Riccia fluitans TaxID=41844 RepID=A0ABD1XME3_9MARC
MPRGEPEGFTKVSHRRNRGKMQGRPGLLDKGVQWNNNIFEVLNADGADLDVNLPSTIEEGAQSDPAGQEHRVVFRIGGILH